MIDSYGRWFMEEDYSKYPEDKLCDYDRIAIKIQNDGYVPKTSFENLITMIFSYYENQCDDYGYDRDNMDDCYNFVMESGGWSEFDYTD